ncbi:MAG: RNA polymerase sigma factor [Candidatus Magnetobacterium sp. LHC-1]
MIEKHLSLLWRVALRMTGNIEDAEDLVQDTCLKAFDNISSLKATSKAKAWLLKIMKNIFLNNTRKDSGIQKEEIETDFHEHIFYQNGIYVDLEKEIFSRVLDDEIDSAINSLPVDFRIPVILIDIEELTYREVEDILNIPSGTIASRLYRGRRLLRDTLFEYARERGYVKEGKNGL